jgi:hypothetical protein
MPKLFKVLLVATAACLILGGVAFSAGMLSYPQIETTSDSDVLAGVDVDDDTDDPTGSTKKWLFSDVWSYISGKLTVGNYMQSTATADPVMIWQDSEIGDADKAIAKAYADAIVETAGSVTSDWFLTLKNGASWPEVVRFDMTADRWESTKNFMTTGTISGRTPIVPSTGTINLDSDYFGKIILMTGEGEVGLPDCSVSTIGAPILIWVRDASEQVEVVAYGDTTGDLFRLKDGTETGANDEVDLPTTGNQGFCFVCMEENKWYVTREDGTVTDGGVAD